MKDLKVEEYFAIGITMARKDYWIIFFRFLITCATCGIAALTVIGVLLVPAFVAGFYKFLLRTARGVSEGIMDSWWPGIQDGTWWKSLLLGLISVVGIVVGFMLLLIPGIYLATVWLLAWFLLVDKDMFPTEALGQSRELVHTLGFWKVFGVYALLTIVTQIISLIPLMNILVLFAMPFVMMIYVAVYENAIKHYSSQPLEERIGN